MKPPKKDTQLTEKKPFKFSWNTPERRAGDTGRALPLIPNEIYLAIYDYFELYDATDSVQSTEYRTTMSNLALVCRFFCAEALPRIFRCMEYSGLSHGHSTPSYTKFCRKLIAGDETACYLGQYVKQCSVVHWMKAIEPGQWVFGNFLKLYIKSIPCLTHLEILRLDDIPIDLQFIAALGILQKLKSLSISRCDFATLTKNAPRSVESLTLLEFELFGNCNCAFLSHLARLVSSISLRTLRTDDWGFMKALISQQVDFRMETLMIPIWVSEDTIPLQDFFNRNPSILDLSIIEDVHIEDIQTTELFNSLARPRLNLATSSLPQLNRLECPTSLLADLVPTRPLKSIQICPPIFPRFHGEDAPRNENIMLALTRSSASVTVLRVSGDVYDVTICRRFFPQLDTLILDIPLLHDPGDSVTFIRQLCRKWLESPPIRHLQFNFYMLAKSWDLDLPLQLSMLTKITAIFPTVHRVRIAREVEWRRNSSQDERWRPWVLDGQRAILRMMLRNFDRIGERVQDYEECFAALFDPTSVSDKGYLQRLRMSTVRHGGCEA